MPSQALTMTTKLWVKKELRNIITVLPDMVLWNCKSFNGETLEWFSAGRHNKFWVTGNAIFSCSDHVRIRLKLRAPNPTDRISRVCQGFHKSLMRSFLVPRRNRPAWRHAIRKWPKVITLSLCMAAKAKIWLLYLCVAAIKVTTMAMYVCLQIAMPIPSVL